MAFEQGNANWFWENYKQGIDWVKKHEVAYWKSHALSLEAENQRLLKIIHDNNLKIPKMRSKKRMRPSKKKRIKFLRDKKRQERKESSCDTGDFEVEVSEELREFFRISLKHKEDLKKERERVETCDLHFSSPQEELDARINEMKQLYGEGYSKIIGMETAMKLAYDRYVDHKSPQYWPSLPIKLSTTS